MLGLRVIGLSRRDKSRRDLSRLYNLVLNFHYPFLAIAGVVYLKFARTTIFNLLSSERLRSPAYFKKLGIFWFLVPSTISINVRVYYKKLTVLILIFGEAAH
jgi:hypothetical protein